MSGPRAAVAALAATMAVLAASGCGSEERAAELAATGAYIPEPVTQEMASGFLTIENTGEADDTLTSVTSDIADTVEIHNTVDNAMRHVETLRVPAGGELRLGRGGSHLMLLGLSRAPAEGDTVTIELRFETSDPISLDVPVEATTYTGE